MLQSHEKGPMGMGARRSLAQKQRLPVLVDFHLLFNWHLGSNWGLSRAVGGSGSMHGAWGPSEATVGCCCLCSGQKVGGQMVQDSLWYVREALTRRWQGLTWLFRRWAAESAWCFPLLALLCVSLAHAQMLDLLHEEQICTVWYAPNISETSKKY